VGEGNISFLKKAKSKKQKMKPKQKGLVKKKKKRPVATLPPLAQQLPLQVESARTPVQIAAHLAPWQQTLEQERCQADILYELFMHPTPAMVDPLLTTCLDMVTKRYELAPSRMWSAARNTTLQLMSMDMDLKVFRILFALAWMPEVKKLIIKACAPTSLLWSTPQQAEQHVDALVTHLKMRFDEMLSGNMSEVSLPHQVPDVVCEARRLYLTT
jgi:hypothetical protein